MLKKQFGKIVFSLFFSISVLLFIGSIYQLSVTKIDDERFPTPGYLVDVGGYQLHFTLTGQKGPVVILDAGLGCNCLDWALVQPELSKFTRAVAFDRAGYGWSDAGPSPRTAKQIVEELHLMLKAADLPAPYILVGHSFGGINARLFAQEYPEEVLGLVLVDASHEELLKKMPFIPYKSVKTILKFLSIFAPTGIHRLLIPSLFGNDFSCYPEGLLALRKAKQNQVKTIKAAYNELRAFKKSLRQIDKQNLSLKEKPIYVISAGIVDPMIGFNEEKAKKFEQIWASLQRELAQKSSLGKLIVAEKSGHMIHWNEPELIVNAVQAIIKDQIVFSDK